MADAGASQAAIDQMLAARYGLIRADAGPDPEEIVPLSSTVSDIYLSPPSIYFDDRFDRWVARSTFTWKHTCSIAGHVECWLKDCPAASGNCGGSDGFGEHFNNSVDEVRSSFYTYDQAHNQTTWSYPEDMNSAGVSFVGQDSVSVGKYNWDSGTVYYMFYLTGCYPGKQYKLYSRLSHTWSTTYISGFGVSTSGFTVTFGSGSNDWQATINQPATWYPC